MKTIIAGSRSIKDYDVVVSAIKASGFTITEVVSGGAIGIDQLGERYAFEHSIPVKVFYPNWGFHGKSAGFIRNTQMVFYSDALIAIWDGISKGTQHTISEANKKGIPVFVFHSGGIVSKENDICIIKGCCSR